MPFDQIDAIIVKYESDEPLTEGEFLALSAHLGNYIPTDADLAADAARLAEEEDEDFSDLLELCQ